MSKHAMASKSSPDIEHPAGRAGDSVEGILKYAAPDTKSSRRFIFPGDEVNTGKFVPHRATIRNARAAPERPSLDTHGFELFRHESAVASFADTVAVDALYPHEVTDRVRALTGADLVVPVGYVRRTSLDTSAGQAMPPASDVHVDMSPATAPRMARNLFATAAPGGTYRRFLITSLWRTFSEPPQDWPLALCDHRTIAPEEGVPNYLVRVATRPDPGFLEQEIPNEQELPAALVFRWGPHHRWSYFPDMTRDEIILIKLHDSDHARAWFAPHTAFQDTSRAGLRTRESIEFRTIAYWL
jgi:hypothetical protein